jgi:fatty acid synthase
MLVLAENRWGTFKTNLPKYLGFLSNMEKFDASFFGIPQKMAEHIDPQSRLLLEHAYEAIMDAGKNIFIIWHDDFSLERQLNRC